MAECILIVDDDPVQRRLVEAMAVRFGYQALTAEGGDTALALLGDPQVRIDCVILDLVMPDLDGLGVLAKMRERGLRVPVIVQTAHGGIDNVVSAMRAGAADFVVKPVGPERLQVSLRNALAQSALEGELQRIKHARSRHAHLPGSRQPQPADAACHAHRGKGRGLLHPGADRGRVRRRQGIDRARHSWQQRAPRETIRRRQLRRYPGKSG